jgi:hypothetical protein
MGLSFQSVARTMGLSLVADVVPWEYITVLDQSEADGDLDWLNEMPGSIVMETAFERGGTLDGKECIIGLLDLWSRIFAENQDVTHIIKKDSDVIMRGTRFLYEIHAEGCDFYGAELQKEVRNEAGELVMTYPFAPGMTYIISREMVSALMKQGKAGFEGHLERADKLIKGLLSAERPAGPSWPEDEAIFTLIRVLGLDCIAKLNKDRNFLARWDYLAHGALPTPDQVWAMRGVDFLDFGRTYPLGGLYPLREQRLALVENAMRAVLG